ncbi:isoaspartyl peptidase/L-asparaginase family protein [Lentisalinibacter orientalis]|uniref:isoaspartyl peptidase/L-asparaginase family protein n=1 Tax=Lentisalinibacter orientalis TaxID=2992241 RepID=UPI0038652031
MRQTARALTLTVALLAGMATPTALPAAEHPVAIAIHAGAGTMSREETTPEQDATIRAELEQAVRVGHRVLTEGGTSLQAVQAAVNILEDSPFFNAGKGAVFNAEGENELDASVMDGATLNAGAVAAVRRIANPIDLALAVMTESRHVMLIGEGAETFAVEQGFELVDPAYFHTERRWRQLQEAKKAETAARTGEAGRWYSTVGAVALDREGNLAAGTSTGGLTNKRWGRVGDTPIIGAGTYANNESCAVSATGTGEYFIRYVVAHSICEHVRDGVSIDEAAGRLIHEVLPAAGGDGGVIAMDAAGNIAMPHNTPGMYRASIGTDGRVTVEIYATP